MDSKTLFNIYNTGWFEKEKEVSCAYVAGICGNPSFPEMPRQFRNAWVFLNCLGI